MQQHHGGSVARLNWLQMPVEPAVLSHLNSLFGNFHGGLLSYGINSGPLIFPFPVPIPQLDSLSLPKFAILFPWPMVNFPVGEITL